MCAHHASQGGGRVEEALEGREVSCPPPQVRPEPQMPCKTETSAGLAHRLPPGISAETPGQESPPRGPPRLLHASGSGNRHAPRGCAEASTSRTPLMACAQGSCFSHAVVLLEFPCAFDNRQDLPVGLYSGLSPPLCSLRTVTP